MIVGIKIDKTKLTILNLDVSNSEKHDEKRARDFTR